jgi:DNA-binding transcriptional LysR family regulator
LQVIERRLQGRDARMAGLVRINVPEAFASELFMAELGGFSRQHPQVVIEVFRAWQPPDLDKREADLSVVLTDDPPGHLIGRPLGRMSLAAYGHVDATDDSEQPWLDSSLEQALAPGYAAQRFPNRRIGGYLQSVDLQLAATRAGMGSTLLPSHLGEQDPQLARVQRGTDRADVLRREVWLLSHPDSRGVARVQAVAELMIETVRRLNLEIAE